MKNPYSHIDYDRQLIRAVYALIIFGDALRFLPELEGTASDMKTVARVQKWFYAASDEIALNNVKTRYEQRFQVSWRKYQREASKPLGSRSFHRVAVFMAGAMLVLDARITCPAVARKRNWQYLIKASDCLENFLIDHFPGCDEKGCNLYEKLCWNAERKE